MLTDGQKHFAVLDDRGVIALRGADARAFLQNLVTNDIDRAGPERAIWTALLTPQGKYLHDFFVVEVDGALMLDCERARIDDLIARLEKYRLRSKVEITDASDEWAVVALIGTEADSAALAGSEGRAGAFGGGVCYVDPRFAGIGARALMRREQLPALRAAGFVKAEAADYDLARLINGLPDGSRDLVVDKAYLLENGFDALNGIDWDKGCYVGQEMTARMHYRATARRRLLPVEIAGEPPAPGTGIRLGDKDAGEMRSARDGIGLALLRVEALEALHESGGELRAGAATLTPMRPPWLRAENGGDET